MFSTSPTQSAIGAAPSFAAHFDGPLPRGLREEADSMSIDAFHDEVRAVLGPAAARAWQCTDADRPASRLGPQARNYQATIAVGDRIGTSTAAASGPVAALTAMLHDRGISVEIAAFHQRPPTGAPRRSSGAPTVSASRHPARGRAQILPSRPRRPRRFLPPAWPRRRRTAVLRAGAGARAAGTRPSLLAQADQRLRRLNLPSG